MVEWLELRFKPRKYGYLAEPEANVTIGIYPKINQPKVLQIPCSRLLKSEEENTGLWFKEKFRNMKKIYASILFPWQMEDIYKMFVHSRTFFTFRNYNIHNNEFEG